MTKCRILAADIGSTITKISAFAREFRFLGQGAARTSVEEGDVSLSFKRALQILEEDLHIDTSGAELLVAASAAGGLRMSVHGLTRDMTLRAAREACLGAGANLVYTTAGLLTWDEIREITARSPNLLLLAGGVDFGDKSTVIRNARLLASSGIKAPVIYAGNRSASGEVGRIFKNAGLKLWMVENVYPRIDELNMKPVREMIQKVFSRHLVTAPGMDRVRSMASGDILPTPGAVLKASELLYGHLGDLLTVDVGGATTDIHSVTEGSRDHTRIQAGPEPLSKRTVEGDLGVFFNVPKIVEASGGALEEIGSVDALPREKGEREQVHLLTHWAANVALWRHAGEIKTVYGAYGRSELIEGRDLTAVRAVIGTGGALTRLDGGREILSALWPDPKKVKLLPGKRAEVFLDTSYIMAAAGVISQQYPGQALTLLLKSLGCSRALASGE